MTNSENMIIVGKFGASYGIRGWIKVFSFTEDQGTLFDYQPWFIKQAGKWQEVIVESVKQHNQEIIVKLNGIEDRDIATTLTNLEIYVDGDNLPKLAEGDFYWKDLIGCKVITTAGYDLGQVTDLMETGSNDVLVVKANLKDAFGARERLIPFVEQQVIKNVDLNSKQVIVDWDPAF